MLDCDANGVDILRVARQVVPQALRKQVSTSVLNVRALHTLYMRAVWTPTANEPEEGHS